jgi:hypothetical protein
MSSKDWNRHSAIFIVADEGDYTQVSTMNEFLAR